MSMPRRLSISERFRGSSNTPIKATSALREKAIGVRDSLLEQQGKFAGFEQRVDEAKDIKDLKTLEKEVLKERVKLRDSARTRQEITRLAQRNR